MKEIEDDFIMIKKENLSNILKFLSKLKSLTDELNKFVHETDLSVDAKQVAQDKEECYYNEFGQLHRINGPALTREDGIEEYWLNGKRHRTDGPALIEDGTEFWYLEDKLHRADGPAITRDDGTTEWWFYGFRHRDDGPAIERGNHQEWWLCGKLHRDDGGPVIITDNGLEYFGHPSEDPKVLEAVRLSEEKYKKINYVPQIEYASKEENPIYKMIQIVAEKFKQKEE